MIEREEAIRVRAYFHFENRTGQNWSDEVANWVQAEEETRSSAEGKLPAVPSTSTSTWTYRHRIRIAPSSGILIEEGEIEILLDGLGILTICSWPNKSKPIKDTEWILIKGKCPSDNEARRRGVAVAAALECAFASLRIGADFGRGAPGGGLTKIGRQMMESAHGVPILNDERGLMVYESEPAPKFAHMGDVTVKLTMQKDRFVRALSAAVERKVVRSERQMLAYDLYAASHFAASPDARLIALVMAIETMLEPVPRSQEASAHVERMISLTRDNPDLQVTERQSMVSSLTYMKQESIGSSGRALVTGLLPGRMYGDYTPQKLWNVAYELRSRLVHGGVPRPDRDQVGRCAAQLEVMVASILSTDILDVDV